MKAIFDDPAATVTVFDRNGGSSRAEGRARTAMLDQLRKRFDAGAIPRAAVMADQYKIERRRCGGLGGYSIVFGRVANVARPAIPGAGTANVSESTVEVYVGENAASMRLTVGAERESLLRELRNSDVTARHAQGARTHVRSTRRAHGQIFKAGWCAYNGSEGLKVLDRLFSDATSVSRELKDKRREIKALEAELTYLQHAPITFDEWKAAVVRSVDLMAEEFKNSACSCCKGAIVRKEISCGSAGNWPTESTPARRNALFSCDGEASLSGLRGVGTEFLVLALREPLKAALESVIEPSRESWLPSKECGPPLVEREARITEITAAVAKLESEVKSVSDRLTTAGVDIVG